MKTIKYTNESGDVDVEFLVDLISTNDFLTVYDIQGLSESEIASGISFRDLDTTSLTAMETFSEDNNLTMQVFEDGETTITSNSYTALAVTTAALPTGSATGVIQIEIITLPAVSAAAQGDYIVLSNTNGETLAAWIDIDADGTEPTGVKYTGADYQAKISTVTGGTAIENGALFAHAVLVQPNWSKYVTILDNANATVTLTQKSAGGADDADPENTGSTGAGSITASTSADGVGGAAQIETVTVPTTAGATQGDFIVLSNYNNESIAAWLDIDATGTTPSGTKYSATDYQVKVSIAGAAAAAANGTLLYAAVLAETDWSDYVTLADVGDGTFTVTQNAERRVTDAEVLAIAEGGAGSIASATGTNGRDPYYMMDVAAITAVTAAADGGSEPLVWTATGLPDGLSIAPSTGIISGVTTDSADDYTITLTATDYFDVTDDSASITLTLE